MPVEAVHGEVPETDPPRLVLRPKGGPRRRRGANRALGGGGLFRRRDGGGARGRRPRCLCALCSPTVARLDAPRPDGAGAVARLATHAPDQPHPLRLAPPRRLRQAGPGADQNGLLLEGAVETVLGARRRGPRVSGGARLRGLFPLRLRIRRRCSAPRRDAVDGPFLRVCDARAAARPGPGDVWSERQGRLGGRLGSKSGPVLLRLHVQRGHGAVRPRAHLQGPGRLGGVGDSARL
mmetsp:Transcript_24949/g.83836  ORF Transcript_24949/g.83836 Transcript_24949/m.83836 type:complete len:236 (+) Transcript_24949:797-1504(+)